MSGRASWLPVTDGRGLAALPYGVVRPRPGTAAAAADDAPRVAVRLGEACVDLAALADAGLLDVVDGLHDPAGRTRTDTLRPLLALPRPAWTGLRARLQDLLAHDGDGALRDDTDLTGRAVLPLADVQELLPVVPGDYVDFYSSLEHATNVGRLFRPDGDPLLPSWRWLPIGYHGRSAGVVVSGTDVRRPSGQRRPGEDGRPPFGPSTRLDVELELGWFTTDGPADGSPVPGEDTWDLVRGVVLVNDWSARDVQAWEYQPLGPFLGKAFATSVSAWVLPVEALDGARVAQREQDPAPLAHLAAGEADVWDLALEVELTPAGGEPSVVSRTSSRHLYWSVRQQMAHATSGGAVVRAGDLWASGTVSGPEPGSEGSLLELTRGGAEPLNLGGGVTRTFLADGDTVVLRGAAEVAGERVALGDVVGTVVPGADSASGP